MIATVVTALLMGFFLGIGVGGALMLPERLTQKVKNSSPT